MGAIEENYQVRDLGQIVSETVAGSTVTYSGKSSLDPRDYRVNFSKIRQAMPQFHTIWTARRGAQELLECAARWISRNRIYKANAFA